jgi:hypothetical protein
MGAYTITTIELDFRVRGVRYRDIRNSLNEIKGLLGEGFATYRIGEYWLLVGNDRAFVFRNRNGHWEGML